MFSSLLLKLSFKHALLTIVCISMAGMCFAQDNPPGIRAKAIDTISNKKVVLWQPNPKKAGLYAALLPGLGQAYNRQYWKLPIVYGGLGVAGYFVVRNSKDYNSLRKAYIGRLGGGTPTDEYAKIYDTEQLRQLQDDAGRLLNMTVLFSSLAYAMQVLDAITSAHLHNFDISRDISMKVQPIVFPGGGGVGLVMNF